MSTVTIRDGGSCIVGTTSQQVYAPLSNTVPALAAGINFDPNIADQVAPAISLLRITNTGPTVIWISRFGPASAMGLGSVELPSLGVELWAAPGPVPVNALSAISMGAPGTLTVEVG